MPDARPSDTRPLDVAPLDVPPSDTAIDLRTTDLGGDSSVDGSTLNDSSVDGSTLNDSSVDRSVLVDSTLDQGASDLEVDGPTPNDASVDQGGPPSVEITEIFPWALAVVDERGEWFELYNPGPGEVSLLNWYIVASRSFHQIASDVRIPAYAYAVLAVNGKMSQNGGVAVDYEYGTAIRLDNDNPEKIRIERPDGSVADEVNFDVGPWGIIEGQALSFIGGADKDNSGNWCAEMTQWLGSSGDYGTPGGPRGCGL